MYPNRIGFAVFGDLKIECLEVCEDDGTVFGQRFLIQGQRHYMSYLELLQWLVPRHPTIAKLLGALGRERFLREVLSWDPSDQDTKHAFYRYLAKVADSEGWDDQPEMEYY
jgi:hypothetical protein